MSDRNADSLQCIGRFQFRTPGNLHVTGRFQSIYRTQLSTLEVTVDQGRAYWNSRLNELRSGAQTRELVETFRVVELAPDVRGVWYSANAAYLP